MGSSKVNADRIISILVLIFILWRFSWQVRCQLLDGLNQTSDTVLHLLLDEYNKTISPELLPLVTKLIYKHLSNLTDIYQGEISRKLAFCIKDQEKDWNGAFDFTSDLDFLSSCIGRTKGDIALSLCTAAEIKFYFSRFVATSYLMPNKNCNMTTWNPGCEPGWACRVGLDDPIDLRNSKDMPTRTSSCHSCCAGFFCPHGLTCMIPCPLGSYCPLAELNKATSACDPYRYHLPPGHRNHTCGGADSWADIRSSWEVFCPAGSYCPSTTKKIPCSDGHYCRTGSTSEKSFSYFAIFFRLYSFKSNMAALTTLLIIIYNCSGHVLVIRERRNAKSREAAARSVRRAAQAHVRGKAAGDVVKKHASGLQKSLSRTFSCQKAAIQPEEIIVLGQIRSELDKGIGFSHASQQKSYIADKTKKKGSGSPTQNKQELSDDLSLESGKNHAPEGRHMHTNSQIFKYVYGKIEREKALQLENKNLTFSGIIKMPTGIGIATRPMIEVSFEDLTLTLKGKNKHLLGGVTGKIMPGRISAVMGPSGAGKTTFLNALAGKAMGCKRTGIILINGMNDSIHSYKKLVGFVPQDDIVHGNLTVEENLLFSAKCRLSSGMPKADKVLIIERVIDYLGLHYVIDSLVGTVENRGISGGQRKRVNVGLEMVMEPSLLLLDEPTSGLDSSSSQLLLSALRREALQGVNICTVVHQPSYSLFKMFDDLILLSRGGLTVYHGPVKEAEDYFAGLGVIVPDRVNPPDHFIDVMEGIVPSQSIDIKQLPLRWRLHKGYPIPPDMQLSVVDIAISSRGPDLSNETDCESDVDEVEESSFAGDLY